jgi:tetratricopeptide (TPR) repeat protein
MLTERGTKVIVIQARGGVGKTTLARKYLQQGFGTSLEFPIAKETKDIASVESLIEEKLRQLGEEPGREFLVSIDRLKRKLQAERIGILIDNLEPALDSAGKFIELHRGYVELLRVLTDPGVRSLTLITSRERLNESSISVEPYLLKELSLEAWRQYFHNRFRLLDFERNEFEYADSSALANLQNAYGGNAKAMDILCGAILTDYDGKITAYWEANQNDLLIERALEDLVVGQFDRVQQLDPDAYKLLCRMGCYRYQDVPTVPLEGLLCLLWDVPENRQRRVVKALQERSLVEHKNEEFWLHPVIRGEAIGRLREDETWRRISCETAQFWLQSVDTIDSINDVVKAFEAYYHYVAIGDYEKASLVILSKKKSRSVDYAEIELGRSLYRLGSMQQTITSIRKVIENIESKLYLSKLYNILAVPCRISGSIHQAIYYHQKAADLAVQYFDDFPGFQNDAQELKLSRLHSLVGLCLCKIALWELQEAFDILNDVNDLKEYISITEIGVYTTDCFSVFLNSCLFPNEKNTESTDSIYEKLKYSSQIGTGFRVLYLGMTYKNLGEFCKAFEVYSKVILHAEEFQYPGTKAVAMNLIAEVYRERGDFSLALFNHVEAVKSLRQFGALADLAGAYYQLGLTHQAMGRQDKSVESFQEAIRLFTGMEAPKQVERVRRSLENQA